MDFSDIRQAIWANSDNINTKTTARRPVSRDFTENYTANRALTTGLYNNTFPGLRLAGGLAFPVIALPVFFMGVPTPIHDDEKVKQLIDDTVRDFVTEMQSIHIQCHREGTIWVWPKYDRYSGKIIWEFIPDDSVVDIVRDLSSGQIVSIWTDEQINLSIGYNEKRIIRRIRNFTDKQIAVKYIGDLAGISGQLNDISMRNPIGMMPIPFANNSDGDEIRGHSDYERLLPTFKSYHDISLAEQEILAKFKPKMVFEVQDVAKWLKQNQYSSIDEIDVASIDLIFNLADKEKVTFINPGAMIDGHEKALNRNFLLGVESSGIPEIIWGPTVSGNYASSADAMSALVKYVDDKKSQKNEPYLKLWTGTLRLEAQITLQDFDLSGLQIAWNDLDSVSEETKINIFQKFASGVSQLITGAGATLDQIHKLWLSQFPKATESDYDKFVLGLNETARLSQYAKASYTEALGMSGEVNKNIDQNGSSN